MGRAAPLIVCERGGGAGSIGGEGSAGAVPEGGIESPFGHRPLFEPIEPAEPISSAIKGQNVSGARLAPSP